MTSPQTSRTLRNDARMRTRGLVLGLTTAMVLGAHGTAWGSRVAMNGPDMELRGLPGEANDVTVVF